MGRTTGLAGAKRENQGLGEAGFLYAGKLLLFICQNDATAASEDIDRPEMNRICVNR